MFYAALAAERSLLCPDPEEEHEAEAAEEAAASAREDSAEAAPAEEAADLAEDIITTITTTYRSASGFGRAPIISDTAEAFSEDFSLCCFSPLSF